MHIRARPGLRSGIAADLGLGIVFAATLVGTAIAIATTWGGAYWLFDCAAGTVVCLIALARRRHRAWAAAAGLAVAATAIPVAELAELPSEPGPAMILGLGVLVGSALRSLPARSAAAVATGGLAVVVGAWLAGFSGVAVFSTAGWLATVVVGLGLRVLEARRRAIGENVRRDERMQMARELHDVAAHHITGIVLHAQAAQLVAETHAEQVRPSLAEIEAAGTDALAAIRRVVGLLRDADDAAPAAAGPGRLDELVERFAAAGPAVHLRLPDGERCWPPEVTNTVYRVVQESLTNVSRHAPHARSVTVTVVQDRRTVTVEVVDDAPAGPARYHHRGGYGLVGMRERVEALGGTLDAGPRPDAGWSVLATLPVPTGGR